MSSDLDKIYNACNPFLPATEKNYFDCRDARGGDAFLKNVFNNLKRTEPIKRGENAKERFHHFLFSGHIGSGKSSELKHLVEQLNSKGKSELNTSFFPIYIDTFNYLDAFDVSITEILLSIVAEVADTLNSQLGIKLESSFLTKQIQQFKEFFSDLRVDSFEISSWKSKLKINRLKQDANARQRIREVLGNKIPTLLAEINLLFERARLEIRKKEFGELSLNFSDIVIIVDNLEKIEKFESHEQGLVSYERLFIDSYPLLTGLQSHVIFTVPLRLVRSSIGTILGDYYSKPFVLPMVKIVKRGTDERFGKGEDALKKVLQRRLGKIKITDAFTDEALNFLLKYSGGNIRYFISFVREATTYTDTLPITISEAKNAIKQTVATFSTAIPEHHWELLAKLDLSKDQRFPNDNEDYRKMLENLSVLEYINGGNEDIFEEVAPWYAVNPIVKELRQFKDARDRISAEATQKLEEAKVETATKELEKVRRKP